MAFTLFGEPETPTRSRTRFNDSLVRLDVFKSLPRMSFRGVECAVLGRSMQFQHGRAEHSFLYRDKSQIEQQGKRNLQFSYTLCFRESIESGSYRKLFSERLPAFRTAFEDRTPANLVDPFYGTLRVAPDSWSEQEAVGDRGRDGLDVAVTFIEAPPQTESSKQPAATPRGVQQDAQRIGQAFAATFAALPEVLDPELSNPLDLLSAVLDQADRFAEKIGAALGQVINRAERAERDVIQLADPQQWPLRQELRQLQLRCRDLRKNLATTTRVVRELFLDADTPLKDVAAKTKSSLRELLELNPGIAAQPIVPSGTGILYAVTLNG